LPLISLKSTHSVLALEFPSLVVVITHKFPVPDLRVMISTRGGGKLAARDGLPTFP
jgi:hypothetical protein